MTGDWVAYTGERDKKYYDIMLNTGEIIECCYPNSYSWYSQLVSPSEEYKDEDVAFIRDCPHHPLDHPNNTWRRKKRK